MQSKLVSLYLRSSIINQLRTFRLILYELIIQIQWGSEYRTCLMFKWSKRGWMPNDLSTLQQNHLNTRQMDAILFSYVLVRYSNGWLSTQDITHHLNTSYRSSGFLQKFSIFCRTSPGLECQRLLTGPRKGHLSPHFFPYFLFILFVSQIKLSLLIFLF